MDLNDEISRLNWDVFGSILSQRKNKVQNESITGKVKLHASMRIIGHVAFCPVLSLTAEKTRREGFCFLPNAHTITSRAEKVDSQV